MLMRDETKLKNLNLFVLDLVGMELTSFTAARIMLIFGFVAQKVLITQWHFGCS